MGRESSINWKYLSSLANKYVCHTKEGCSLNATHHGTSVRYEDEKLLDDRCSEQVRLTDEIIDLVYPYLSFIASNLLKNSFLILTKKGPRLIGVGRGNNIEDLVQESVLGIIGSLRNYDSNRSMKSFVLINAASKMIQYSYRNTLVRLPSQVWNKQIKIKPREADIVSAMMGYTETENYSVRERGRTGPRVVSIDKPFRNSGGKIETLKDLLKNNSPNPEEELEYELEKRLMDKTLSKLGEKLKKILTLRFGFINDREYTFKEIGGEIGVTKQRVEQLVKRTIKKLSHSKNMQILAGH